MFRGVFFCFMAAVGALGAVTAHASPLALTGKTVGYQYLLPNMSTVFHQGPDIVVGPGIERDTLYSESDSLGAVDIGDGYLQITFKSQLAFSAAAFNGIHIYDVNNSIDDIFSVDLATGSTKTPILTFNKDSVYVNLQQLSVVRGDVIRVSIEGGPNGVVPEPASFGLAGLALLGLSFTRRKRV